MSQPPSLEEDFHLLAEFLGKFGAPAEGHAREKLTSEEEGQLRKLAAGELDEEERKALIPLLIRNVTAMEFLRDAA